MLGKMKQTLAKKQEAVDKLKGKSRALQKNMEPRGAYKLGKGHQFVTGSENGEGSPEASQAHMTM